jgi:peptidoglycan/LPS O-acetylase OafA/YrhL
MQLHPRYTANVSSLPEVTTQRPEQRVQGMDLLRGLCIVAVVLHHINLRIRFNQSGLGKLMGPAANRVLFWSGYYGVIVFFVISGFLITTWSLKRWGSLRQISLRQFYLMRFARIVPCLVGLLAILGLLDRFGVPRFVINTQHTSLLRALLAALTFHVNWLEARTGYLPASWDVLWSLSVEEVFYLFFPLLYTLLRKQALIISVLCCFMAIGPWARIHMQGLWADYGYLSCMDGIALGSLAAMAAAKLRLRARANRALLMTGVLLCLLIVVFRATAARIGFYKWGLDVTVLEFGVALLMITLQLRFNGAAVRHSAAASMSTGSSSGKIQLSSAARLLFRSTAFLRWFGRNSYEVYLTHMFVIWPIVWLFQRFGARIDSAPWWFLLATTLAGLLGWVVARFYSEPLNRGLRWKLAPTRTADSAAAG